MNKFDIYKKDVFENEFSGKTIFSNGELDAIRSQIYNKGAWNCKEDDVDSILAFLNSFTRYSYEDVLIKYGALFNCVDPDDVCVLMNYTDLIIGDNGTILLIDFNVFDSIKRLYEACAEISYDGLSEGKFKIQCPKCDSYSIFKEDNYFRMYTGTNVYSGSTVVCKNCGFIDKMF